MSGASRILLVEDDADLAASLQVVLEEAGYLVTVTGDGAEALGACSEGPALVLVDYYLPGDLSGRRLVSALRGATAPSARILILSAARDVSARSEEAGADGFLEKPFDIDALLRTVERYLAGQAPLFPISP